ncbi:MAG: Crp/Fnr family transcriptional regulator [Acidimicrobiales bacterium]
MTDTTLLAATELFGSLEPAQLQSIADLSTLVALKRNDLLFSENDKGDALYVVATGRIAIANRSFDGRESMVALMEPGDLFGEMGLFDNGGRTAEVRALAPSTAVRVPYAPVRELYGDHPQLLWQVVKLLAGRLRNMDNALADSVFLDVSGRTAKRLLELAGDGDEFTLPITQEELAGMVGASRERVNKAIASFIRLGWLEQRDRRYKITNRTQMEIRSQ